MKQFHAYKRQYKLHRRRLGILGVTCVITILFLLFTPVFFSLAQTTDQLQAQIDAHNKSIADLEVKNQAIQKQLDNLGAQEDSLASTLKQLNLSKEKLLSDIAITQDKIQEKNLEISQLSSQIGVKQNSISKNVDLISTEIRQTNEMESGTFVESILSDNKISEVWRDVNSLATIRDQIRGQNVELKTVKGQLENTKQTTSNARQQLVTLKSQLSDQEKIIVQNTNQKKKLLSQTKNNEALYQKNLKANMAKEKTFEDELANYEAQLKYTLNPGSLPGSGVLSWPLASLHITSPFGARTLGGVAGFHNGTDFRASLGTPVMAMADGVVAGTGDTDKECNGVSFGKFVLIKYDNGLASTYGHFSLIKASTGDRVSRGEVVGYSGSTGYSTGPHLHVSIYPKDAVAVKTLPSKSCPGHNLTQPIAATNAYLNPMTYISK